MTVPDRMPTSAPANQPTPSTSEQTSSLTPHQKGQQGVDRAIAEFKAEGGVVHATEVTVELDGVKNRFDFVGELNDELHLFEVKNGPTAKFTPGQAINIPKMQATNPAFIPRGMNAFRVPQFKNYVDKPYTKGYTVRVKIYF